MFSTSSISGLLPTGAPLSFNTELSGSHADLKQQSSMYSSRTAALTSSVPVSRQLAAAQGSATPHTATTASADGHSVTIGTIDSQQIPNSTTAPQLATGTAGSPQPQHIGGNAASNDTLGCCTVAGLKIFVLENFMLLSFSLAAAFAMAWPLPGKVVASWAIADVRVIQALNNFLVFLISGLTLKSDDFRYGLAV